MSWKPAEVKFDGGLKYSADNEHGRHGRGTTTRECGWFPDPRSLIPDPRSPLTEPRNPLQSAGRCIACAEDRSFRPRRRTARVAALDNPADAVNDPRVADECVVRVDVAIFGGGVAGLWLLDELRRSGYSAVLLESRELGSGQTVASQGIIHGGLKYTLTGLATSAARSIREMPHIWRECLAGQREPDLSAVRLRSEHCVLWRTSDLRSRAGMIGARVGLRVRPTRLEREAWPAALAGCPGDVFRLDEQVIDPCSLLDTLLERNRERILAFDDSVTLENKSTNDAAEGVILKRRGDRGVTRVLPRAVVLCAGAGNASLRERLGLSESLMQRRPLHMVMLRGELPELNGHCADGARTRVTITTATDSAGRIVWQVGGQVAEDGVAMERGPLLAHAKSELRAVLPQVDLDRAEWSTYRVERAEASTSSGRRPDDVFVRREENVITAWPSKLALAPRLSEAVRALLDPPAAGACDSGKLCGWPTPRVADPPWETEQAWSREV